MMRALRDKRMMQIILWILIIAFVVGFLFLGGMKYGGFSKEDANVLAKVGDAKITYEEFNKVYQPASEKLYGSNETEPSQEEMKSLKEQVLDQLINNVILEQTARKMGISVPIDEVAASIQRQSYFLDDNGKFDLKRYYQILQSNQITPEQYEASEQEQILMQKIHGILSDSLLYTNNDLEDYAQLLNREMKAVYVAMEYDKFEEKIKITENDLNNYFENHRDYFDHPERAKARHILMSPSETGNIQDEEKTKIKLEEYRNQILSGKAKFGDLAKKYSLDGGSKDKNGELGWLTRGQTVKEFEDVVFNLKKGEISKPFKTKFGFHIVQLEDYEKTYNSKFSDVRVKVLSQYRKEMASKKIFSLSEQLMNKLKHHEALTSAGKELGLTVETTAWFNRDTGIPSLKDSKNIADALSSLYLKEYKGPLSIGKNEYFFQIIDVKPGKSKSEKNLKGQPEIMQRLISDRQSIWIKSFLDSERQRLKVKTYLNE
jgi:peptidyl-prolyl cis-trans isomerase D